MKKIINFVSIFLGLILGILVAFFLEEAYLLEVRLVLKLGLYLSLALAFAMVFYWLIPLIIGQLSIYTKKLEHFLESISGMDLLASTLGLLLGLLLAFLISQPLYRIELPIVGNYLSVLVSVGLFVVFGYLGMRLARFNLRSLLPLGKRREDRDSGIEQLVLGPSLKALDTSVLIDGRLGDILESGFLEGPFILPIFVLEELQNIADSDQDFRRQKGRRGLDHLKSIQKLLGGQLEICEDRIEEIKEVDSKLVKLAQKRQAKLLTNDYNLEKVANVQNVQVLNINRLASALKPIVFPGEKMEVYIMREGKEAGQGVGYLEDGTMIVVEDGGGNIGDLVMTKVTSVLQTPAGKMIFVRIDKRGGEERS